MTFAGWELLSPRDQPAPVLAIELGLDGVWAGGLGGVSWFSARDGWTPPPLSIALHSVTALTRGDGILLAGHESGIARSTDGGKSWHESDSSEDRPTVTDLALSPDFSEDEVGLAATIRNGILRSSDGGRSWKASNFGLGEREAMVLLWLDRNAVLAGTQDGLFHSSNAGRAWLAVPDTNGIAFCALTRFSDGSLLAAPTTGRPLRISSDLSDWQPLESLPHDIQV